MHRQLGAISTFSDMQLYEIYRLNSSSEIRLETIARFVQDSRLEWIQSREVWARRGNLQGMEMKVAFIDNYPFIYKVGSSAHFKGEH